MSKNEMIEAQINPLIFWGLDEPILNPIDLDYESFVKYACNPNLDVSIDELSKRYKQICSKEKRLSIVPNEKRIMNKMIWPLKYAKSNYIFGNYLGTISLCGLVTEMVAILIFEISDFAINKKPMDNKLQEKIWGRTFENLGQEKRINILHAFGTIDDDIKSKFNVVRSIRRRYLHLWSQDLNQLEPDAKNVYFNTVAIVEKVLGQNFKEGKYIINPKMIKYLKRTGVYRLKDD